MRDSRVCPAHLRSVPGAAAAQPAPPCTRPPRPGARHWWRPDGGRSRIAAGLRGASRPHHISNRRQLQVPREHTVSGGRWAPAQACRASARLAHESPPGGPATPPSIVGRCAQRCSQRARRPSTNDCFLQGDLQQLGAACDAIAQCAALRVKPGKLRLKRHARPAGHAAMGGPTCIVPHRVSCRAALAALHPHTARCLPLCPRQAGWACRSRRPSALP